jgi:hypothetical protein
MGSGSSVLRGESRPDEFGCPARIGVRQRAEDHSGRCFGVMGDWITNLHGPTYKTATRAEGKGGEFSQRPRTLWTKFNPAFQACASFSPRSLAKSAQARYTARNEP